MWKKHPVPMALSVSSVQGSSRSRLTLRENFCDAKFSALVDPALEGLLHGGEYFGVSGGDVALAVFILGDVIESIMPATAGSGGEDDFPVLGAQHALFGIDQGLLVFGSQHKVVVVLVIDEVEFIHRRQLGALDIFDAKLDEGESCFGIEGS